MKKRVCKFEIADMLPIGMVLIVAGIGIAFGLQAMGDIRDDIFAEKAVSSTCNATSGVYTGCGADYNASVSAIEGVSKIPTKLPLIVTVIVAALVIGILIKYLVVRAM